MKYWPSSDKCGPTTRPPLSTSQLVATNTASPARSPVTTPATTALSRTTRTSTRASGSFASRAMGALLDELEEAFEQPQLRAAAQDRQREEQHRVAEEREAPPAEGSYGQPVVQAEHADRDGLV